MYPTLNYIQSNSQFFFFKNKGYKQYKVLKLEKKFLKLSVALALRMDKTTKHALFT